MGVAWRGDVYDIDVLPLYYFLPGCAPLLPSILLGRGFDGSSLRPQITFITGTVSLSKKRVICR